MDKGTITVPLDFSSEDKISWDDITPQHKITLRPIYISRFNLSFCETTPVPLNAEIRMATNEEIALYKKKMDSYSFLIDN